MKNLGKVAVATSLALAINACGPNGENNDTRVNSGPTRPDSGFKDSGPDLADMASDMNQSIDATMQDSGVEMDSGHDLNELDTDIKPQINDLKLDCNFDPLDSKSAYQECIDAANKQLSIQDSSLLGYMSEYGIGASSINTTLIQEQTEEIQPQLNESGVLMDPYMVEQNTSKIVEKNLFCLMPKDGQIQLDKLTADPNIPFNNCDSSEMSCSLTFKLNGIDLSTTNKLRSRFRFDCPDLGFDPKVDGQSSNVDNGQSTTIFVEVPFSDSHVINPENCELDSSVGIIGTDCRAFEESLRQDAYINYFGEIFGNTTITINLIGNN